MCKNLLRVSPDPPDLGTASVAGSIVRRGLRWCSLALAGLGLVAGPSHVGASPPDRLPGSGELVAMAPSCPSGLTYEVSSSLCAGVVSVDALRKCAPSTPQVTVTTRGGRCVVSSVSVEDPVLGCYDTVDDPSAWTLDAGAGECVATVVEDYQVRVGERRVPPLTERVRVAPFTQRVRVPPRTERVLVTERVRVAPFTERVRVAPYRERVRVAPYTARGIEDTTGPPEEQTPGLEDEPVEQSDKGSGQAGPGNGGTPGTDIDDADTGDGSGQAGPGDGGTPGTDEGDVGEDSGSGDVGTGDTGELGETHDGEGGVDSSDADDSSDAESPDNEAGSPDAGGAPSDRLR